MNTIKHTFFTLVFLFTVLPSVVFASDPKDGLLALLRTTKGDITVCLFSQDMPVSVANFVSLAEGKRRGDLLKQYQKKSFYDGSKIQGVLKGYSVQTRNSYLGDRNEGLGYQLPIEQNDSLSRLSHILCVSSNSVYNDGSRLVLTLEPFPFINAENTPIGEIIGGIDIAQSLVEGDLIKSVDILRYGKSAKRFDSEKIIEAALERQREEERQFKDSENERLLSDLNAVLDHQDQAYHFFAKAKLEAYEKAEEIGNGIRLMKWKTTDGALPKHGEKIWVSFVGYLPNGTVFDSSYDNSEAMRFTFGNGEQIKAWDLIFEHVRLGEKATVIIPSSMAYGAKGADRTIPPYTSVIFDVTLEEIEE